MASLAEIFEESRKTYADIERGLKYGYVSNMGGTWKYGYGNHRKSWAMIHRFFIVIGAVITILAVVNQFSCIGKGGCLWTKGNDITESLSGPIKDLVRKNFPGT